ncbi:MAG: SOS response-associated peptidase [Capsulimonadaceae bacterium]|nr:SOS response-associated peptidase [Capsulimonadaceae bacterium]
MCARFTLYHSLAEVLERFDDPDVLFNVEPCYNIAPANTAAVILVDGNGRHLAGFRWGLTPVWAADESAGQKLINARAETLAEKPAFKNALRSRRCIIPADGFYEWVADGKERQPLYIRLSDASVFGIAGLWETWRRPDGRALHSFTIITIPANELIAAYHTRMPAMLRREDEAAWLDPVLTDPHAAMSLLKPFPSLEMVAFKVDKKVNRVGADDPSYIAPLLEEPTLGL